MPAFFGGFHGYREDELILGGRTPMVTLLNTVRTPSFSKPPPKFPNRLKWWMFEKLGPIPFQYVVFQGTADDTYPDEWTHIDFNTRVMYGFIQENPALLKFQYRIGFEPEERIFQLGFVLLESVVGFKIKNFLPGMPAIYTIAFMR